MSTLLIRHAECAASFDDARRELRGASVLVSDQLIEAIGPAAELPATARTRARKLVAEQGRTNVEVIQADARNTGLPPAQQRHAGRPAVQFGVVLVAALELFASAECPLPQQESSVPFDPFTLCKQRIADPT